VNMPQRGVEIDPKMPNPRRIDCRLDA